MNRNIKFLSLLTIVLSTTLSSCVFINPDRIPILSSSYQTSQTNTKVDHDIEYKTPDYPSNFTKDNLTKDNIGLGLGSRYLPSTGDCKVLVVPIEFSDGNKYTTSQLQAINNCFFGDSNNTGWESVSSFYKKSSYNKLNISGQVTNPVTSSYSLRNISSMYNKNENYDYLSVVNNILYNAVKSISSSINLDDYDVDSDGYVDGVWLVYNYDYNNANGNDIFWAFTSWQDSQDKISNKLLNNFAWASYSFMENSSYTGMFDSIVNTSDSHTFVHETGHMLGLDDYYTNTRYSNTRSYESPVGAIDMMDNNIIDHMAYSKYFLNWINPTIIDEDYLESHSNIVTINSLEKTGDSYILPLYQNNTKKYNDTPFDEYLILETYTPTGLNQADSLSAYQDGNIAPNVTGLRVYHVNARIGKITVDSASRKLVWDGYSYDKIPINDDDYLAYYYLYSNESSRSYGTLINDETYSYYRTRLVSILSKGKQKNTSLNPITNNSLYTVGDKVFLQGGYYTDFKFDDGNKTKYGFEVTAVENNNSVTIKLETL